MTEPQDASGAVSHLWEIAVDAPLRKPLTYKSSQPLMRGQSVSVPLGKKRAVTGLVVQPQQMPSKFQIKEILGADPERPTLAEPYMKWLEWLSEYYVYPLGEIVNSVFPPLKKQGRASRKSVAVPVAEHRAPPRLNSEQARIVEAIGDPSGFQTHLIFGVTGSGKTEIYLRVIERALQSGHSSLFIVPEISLTPQLIERFTARFGDQVAILHSQLTERERTDQWWSVVDGRKRVLIGARSALFCPVPNLKFIVVDEEHEGSFKQDESLRYHARDAAIMRARLENCTVLLGSATPSQESWKNALDSKYRLHELNERALKAPLPSVDIVDLRNSKFDPFWLSDLLKQKIEDRLQKKEQIALFLNRRGIAHTLICFKCGEARECPNCSVKLTLHAHSHLVCHYCDYHENKPKKCPTCSHLELTEVGLGTEQVEHALREMFPAARIARADRDEIASQTDMTHLIEAIENNEVDIVIGTQMIAKGLDFPNVTLVGVLLADIGMNMPDFRATERSFQLLTQVAGRAGRRTTPGEVVIQAFSVDHPSVRFAQTHDVRGFLEKESIDRAELCYPPFGRCLVFRLNGSKAELVESAAQTLKKRMLALTGKNSQISILGPTAAPLFKIRNKFRYQILVKGPKTHSLSRLASEALGDESWIPSGVSVLPDIDPINML